MDWRRRSSRSGGRASEDGADEVRRAFHTIDMAASTTSTTRRSSRSLSHGAARAESWMARVSSAMSHRIFSGHSRSTQVMPLVSSQAGHGSVDMGAPLAASTSEDSFLAATKPLQQAEVVTLHDCEDANVDGVVDSVDQADVNCPSVAFDVQDSSDESEVERQRVRNVRSQTQSERVPKVAPTRGVAAFDDVDEDDPQPASRVRSSTTFVHSVDAVREASTPGVLQDFFRRPPTAAAELREQQRRARREAHYRRIRERQERLRVRVGSEDAMDAASDADRRRVRAQQLRRLSVARRLEFKREAAAAKELVVARVAAQDARALEEAKQTWERDFADEMRELSDAFHAKTMRLHADVVRPTTVAGLAVPEAAVEIQRRAVSASRRVQTAGDVSPRRLNSQDFHGPVENSVEAMEVLEGADSEEEEGIDLLEADEDEDEEEDVDLAMDLDTLGAEMEGVAVDVDALLREREQLLRRVADIERLVAVRQTLGGA